MIAVYESKRIYAVRELDSFAAGYWASLINEKKNQSKMLISLL